MKKVAIIFFLMVLSKAFCQSTDDFFIKNLATKLKSHDVWIVIPVRNGNETVNIIIKNTYLYQYYLKKHIALDFYIFLDNVLNDKYILNYQSLGTSKTANIIQQDAKIFSTYKSLGFEKFKKRYFNEKSGKLVMKSPYDNSTQNGIIQIMFKHNYYIIFDDYLGYLYFFKTPPL
jgi:hypothetical protein